MLSVAGLCDVCCQQLAWNSMLTLQIATAKWHINRFTALQPLPEAPTVVTMSATAAAGAVERQQEAIEQEAARLVGLVLSDGS